MDGMRKWWMGVVSIGGVVLCLLIILAFGKYSEATGSTAIIACAGIFTGYGVANVVTKKIIPPVLKKK